MADLPITIGVINFFAYLIIPLILIPYFVMRIYFKKSKLSNRTSRISFGLFLSSIALFIWGFIDTEIIRELFGRCEDYCGIEYYIIIWPIVGAIGVISLIVFFITKMTTSRKLGATVKYIRSR